MDKNEIQRAVDEAKSQLWYHFFEVVKGSGVFPPSFIGQLKVGDSKGWTYENRLKFLGWDKEYFKGKRVLDIGTCTGGFAFFLEECGAEVIAIDVMDPNTNGFNVVHKLRNSKVEHRILSVYDLKSDTVGFFDIIAFYGVYYHLKHPLLALELINGVCKDGGFLIGGGTTSDRYFHDQDMSCRNWLNLEKLKINNFSLCGFTSTQFLRDYSNWFIPNTTCLKQWLEASGFKTNKMSTSVFPLQREWIKGKSILRSGSIFLAQKVSEPTAEYQDTANVKFAYTYKTPYLG